MRESSIQNGGNVECHCRVFHAQPHITILPMHNASSKQGDKDNHQSRLVDSQNHSAIVVANNSIHPSLN